VALRRAEAVQWLSGASGSNDESAPSMIGPISLDMKQTGERSAGKRPAAFDEAVVGNVTRVARLRAITKAVELPPAPTSARASSRHYKEAFGYIVRAVQLTAIATLRLAIREWRNHDLRPE
jgi:hypothetical protein